MHHTDYSTNLRQTQHKKMKNVSLNSSRRTGDLRSAILAILMVLFALFQMDPANAQSAKSTAGFGTLQFGFSEQSFPNQPIVAQAIDSAIQMIVYNDTLTLIVDQTFSNPTALKRSGDYIFAIPVDAVVQAGLLSVGDHALCKTIPDKTPDAPPDIQCPENIQTNSWTTLHSERSTHFLRITTPPIDSSQTLHVYLNIEYPVKHGNASVSPLLPYSDDFSAKDLNSVSAAVDAMTTNL